MKEWDENSYDVSKVNKDKEKAKSLLDLINLREEKLNLLDKEDSSTLIVEAYYEIVKELITAIMSIDCYKTTSHEILIGYLAKFHKGFSTFEINIMDQLRKTRNDIAYRGVMVNKEYLERNEQIILKIIEKLKQIVINKLR